MPAEALRRRLYAPGADEQDLVRYRAALPATQPAPAAAPAPRRSRVRRTAPVVGGVLLVVGLIAALPLVQRTAVGPVSTPRPTPMATLRVPAAASARFVQALAAGRPPEVAQYLLLHPRVRPPAVAAASRAIVHEDLGTGPFTVPLHPDLAAEAGGRLTVIVMTDRALPLRWTVSRTAVRPDHRRYEQTVGEQTLHPQPGALLHSTVRYGGAAPQALHVDVQDGVRWDVVTVFTD